MPKSQIDNVKKAFIDNNEAQACYENKIQIII